MKTNVVFQSGLMVIACVLVFSTMALAGGGDPSPSNCSKLGALEVECFECARGKEKYVGKIAVLAAYTEYEGEPYCVERTSANQRCMDMHGVEVPGFYAEYSIGSKKIMEYSWAYCVKKFR